MTGLETAVIIAAGGALYAATRTAERRRTIKVNRSGGRTRIPTRSRLVVMYNATGAKPVEADDAGTAAAELAGRVIGASARRTNRGWQAAHTASQRRWARRQAARPPESVVDKWKTIRTARSHTRKGPRFSARSALRRLGRLLGIVDPQVDTHEPRDVPPEPPPETDPRPQDQPRTTPIPRARPIPHSTGDPEMTTPDGTDTTAEAAIAAPADWSALIARVTDFQPEDDVALIEWMKAEAAGVVAYAAAMDAARENCVNDIGLDPSSVEGITIYSEHMSDASARMTEALTRFFTVYGEVLKLAAEGVVLPHNGRWMTGGTLS